MSVFKFDWWGILGIVIIFGTWMAVNWSIIAQDSVINLLGQLAAAFFLAIEAFRPLTQRSTLIKVSIHILWVLFVIIAIADYVPQF